MFVSSRAGVPKAPWSAAIVMLLAMTALVQHTQAARMLQTPPTLSDIVHRTRSLLATATSECSDNAYVLQPGSPAVPAGAVVQWADLSKPKTEAGGLGWSVPSTRPSAGSEGSPGDISSVTGAYDFYSLQCNGWGNVDADRAKCVKVKGEETPYPVNIEFRYGATHLRYDCATKSLWVLTYVFTDREMKDTIGDMFVKACTDGSSNDSCGNANGDKFVAVATGSESGMTCKADKPCSSTCSTSALGGTTCPFCCQDMWPVVDSAATPKWIGWMARVSFDIPSTKYLEETIVVHFNDKDGSTTSTSTTAGDHTICLYCDGSGEEEVDVPCTPPTVSVTVSDAEVCSNEGTATFTVAVNTTVLPTTLASETPGCTLGSTEVSQTGVSSFELICEALNGILPATVSVKATAGTPTCKSVSTGDGTTTVTTKPEVTIQGPVTAEVCENATALSLTYTLDSGVDGNPLQVTVAGPNSVDCSAPQTDVLSGSSVVVTCQPTPGEWPEGSFTVTLSAVANTALAGCSGQNSTTTTVTVNKLPVLSVEVQGQDFEVCSSDDSFNLTYTIGTGLSGLPFNVITSERCSVTPNSEVASGSNVQMTCWRADQGDNQGGNQWIPGFTAFVEASSGVTGCSDVRRDTRQITVNTLPTVTVSAADKTVCAGGTVDVDFSVSATAGGSAVAWALSGTPTVSVEGVVCTAAVPTATGVKVTCSKAGGLPASFDVTLAASAATAADCANTGRKTVTVTAACCIKGSSYARGQVAGDSFSNATCFSTGMDCKSNNWGWTNRLSGPGAATNHPIIVGGAKECKGRTVVGNISIQCTQDAAQRATVTLGAVQQTLGPNGVVSNHFYLGCGPNNGCTPPVFWSSKNMKPGACKTNDLQLRSCGGSNGAPTVQSATTALLNCPCSSVHYVFHQLSDSFTAARVDGACPAS